MIPIADSSTLWYCSDQRLYATVHQRTSQHVCIARQYRPNTQQCRPAIIISGTVIWKALIYGQSAIGCCCDFEQTNTHIVWSVLCPLNILPVMTTSWRRQQWGRASWVARPAPQCRFYTCGPCCTRQQRCLDRLSLICVSPRSLTKDPHLQTLVIISF